MNSEKQFWTEGGAGYRLLASLRAEGKGAALTILERDLHTRTQGSRRRLAVVALAAVVVAGALLARHGTASMRGLACVVLVVGAAAVAFGVVRSSRRSLAPIVRVLARWAPDGAGRFERAARLLAGTEAGTPWGGSSALAALHFEKAVAPLPLGAVAADLSLRAGRLRLFSGVVAVSAVVTVALLGQRIFEGLDLLFGQDGVAPIPVQWLDDEELTIRPPEYLNLPTESLLLSPRWGGRASGSVRTVVVPAGSMLLFRGVPRKRTARLELFGADGTVPFADNGNGEKVAEWRSVSSEELTVGAWFGDEVIPEWQGVRIVSLPDYAPRVTLDGAPGELRPSDPAVAQGIVLVFEATDDHGLSAVDLVLRSGTREERRSLAHLDGTSRTYAGAEVVPLRDAFLRASVAPVELSIEARDNDGAKGQKWGRSAPITFIPAQIGRPEAMRLDALRELRNALVDSLAWRLSTELPSDPKLHASFMTDELHRHSEDDERMEALLEGRYDGVAFPLRLRAVLRRLAQRESLAIDSEMRSPSSATREAVVRANEHWTVGVDRLTGSLGRTDSVKVAKHLAEVADDLLSASDEIETGRDARSADARALRSIGLLKAGGDAMLHLGALGRDIGEIVVAYLDRIEQARATSDLHGARLAAADLALRLHTPDPSFGSKGGAHRRGPASTESGNEEGEPGDGAGDDEDASDGDGQGGGKGGDALAEEIDRLAAEHNGEMSELEEKVRAAKEALSQHDAGVREDLHRHADLIRDAVRELPSVGNGSDSWTSKGASARESAEQMAHSLEQDGLRDALSAGRHALGALDEASQMARPMRPFLGDRESKAIDKARRDLERELSWVENAAKSEEQRMAEAVKEAMRKESAAEQRIARKAGEIASGRSEGGRHGGTVREPVGDALEEAKRAAEAASEQLRLRELEKGQESQREVQRALDRARQQLDEEKGEDKGEEGAEHGNRDRGGRASATHAVVPGADAHKGPNDLRRRVLEGLSHGNALPIKDAIRRYADGLLR